MKVITSINAKGGCGKSTVASNVAAGLSVLGFNTLLVDMDPQAQITEWYGRGDIYEPANSITAILAGQQSLREVVKPTHLPNLSFVSSSAQLEAVGQHLRNHEGYQSLLAGHLQTVAPFYHFVVIDSPNQVSPVMDNAIVATDLFLVPFLDTSSVRSYPNVYEQIARLRAGDAHKTLHVLTGLSKMPGKRAAVVAMLARMGVEPARTEIRHCAYLGQVDTQGGSIFHYMPKSNGAADVAALVREIAAALDVPMPAVDADRPETTPFTSGVTGDPQEAKGRDVGSSQHDLEEVANPPRYE